MTRLVKLYALLMIAFIPSLTAAAGSSAARAVNFPEDEVAAFANRVQRDLASRGVGVAIVARVGRDPAQIPDGVIYTHLGFFVYSTITLPDGSTGQGYRVYNLYQRGGEPTVSDLVQDSPADFFASAKRLDAGIIIPDPKLQRKLRAVINSPTYPALHNPRYAVLANPRNNQFQNSNEHVLNVLMAAIYDTGSLAQITANITAYFEPQVIAISGLKRAFAPLASAALTTQDHGSVIATTTFGSISRFMDSYDLTSQTYRITPTSVSRF
tara:strand:+ start:8896 stop:9699 length:804 start_codon:yes stop_codon:yes gene_type:complete